VAGIPIGAALEPGVGAEEASEVGVDVDPDVVPDVGPDVVAAAADADPAGVNVHWGEGVALEQALTIKAAAARPPAVRG
jgi:hypothetical protein